MILIRYEKVQVGDLYVFRGVADKHGQRQIKRGIVTEVDRDIQRMLHLIRVQPIDANGTHIDSQQWVYDRPVPPVGQSVTFYRGPDDNYQR